MGCVNNSSRSFNPVPYELQLPLGVTYGVTLGGIIAPPPRIGGAKLGGFEICSAVLIRGPKKSFPLRAGAK